MATMGIEVNVAVNEIPRAEDYERVCGRTIAFVFAASAAAGPNIEAVTVAARDAGAPAIFIMADLVCANEAVDAVRRTQRKGRPMIQGSEMDFADLYGAIVGMDGHLEELPRNLLEVMKALSESVLDVYESVFVIDASKPAPSPEQLYGLALALREQSLEEAFICDAAEPSPYAISRTYLDNLDEE